MKITNTFIVLTALSGILAAPAAHGQGGPRNGGGWGAGSQYSRMDDPKTVETISGEIAGVDHYTPIHGMSSGVHLLVRTAKEAISVHLGPGWFIENQDMALEPKDRATIKGSRITFEGKSALIASEVKKGDDVLKLRDDNDVPVWSGWWRR